MASDPDAFHQLWPAVDVTSWEEVHTDPRGRRSKCWVRNASGEWLRKEHRTGRASEPAIEVFALELARASGLEAASARPCTWRTADDQRRGIAVRLFMDRAHEELSLGSEVLRAHDHGYDGNAPWSQSPSRAREALAKLASETGTDLLTPFVRVLAFDAWIGNCDRHQENWGVIRPQAGVGALVRFAPMYDPAACLGVELHSDFKVLQLLKETGAERYAARCSSGFGDGTRGIPMTEVVAQARAWPEWTHNVRACLEAFEAAMNTAEDLLLGVPTDWLSEPRKALASKLLRVRLRWLQEQA